MERSEAMQVTGLEEWQVYTQSSDGPVWEGLASSAIHAMDLYCYHVDSTYVGYSMGIMAGEETTLDGLCTIGDTVWATFENTQIYAQRAPGEQRDMPVNDEAIEAVIWEANVAFWAKVENTFHAETGDLSPLTAIALEQAQRRAVTEWVAANVRKHYVAVVFDVTGLTDDAAGRVVSEAQVQGEQNEYHPDVTSCTIQTTTQGGTMDDFLDELPHGWGEY